MLHNGSIFNFSKKHQISHVIYNIYLNKCLHISERQLKIMKLKGKTGIVTGAGRGIGKAVASILAHEGANVIVNDTDKESAETTANEIYRQGFEAFPLCADVSNQEQVQEMVDTVIQKYGRIDILINNAAVQTVIPFFELSETEWKRILNVNLTGTFLCSQAAAKKMIPNNYGKIVNIGSIHYDVPRLDKFHYDTSKAGMAIFTKELALELAKYRINVNYVALGAFETPMNSDIIENRGKIDTVTSRIPLGRMGKPEEAAKLVLFLVSDDAEYITGSIINIDGGRSLFNG